MIKKAAPVKTVDAYIAGFPPAVSKRMQQLRKLIKAAAPDAEEGISYGMAGYKYGGPLVYFAGFENHIGFYALPVTQVVFKKELAGYKTGKGSIQFQHTEALPVDLIKKMLAYRVKANEEAAAKKSKAKAPAKKKARQ